jgi:hypothetical protein
MQSRSFWRHLSPIGLTVAAGDTRFKRLKLEWGFVDGDKLPSF